ncbi:MAG: MATE family efflux transporter [Spirochaetota bacterium]
MKKDLSPEAGPLPRVFFHYVIPSVLGMVAVSSAGVVDGIFVGKFVGAEALAAVNLTIPLITLISGIVLMLSIGSGVVCGKYLGEKNGPAAADTFTKTNILIGFFCAVSMTLGFIFIDPLISLLGAEEVLNGLVKEYLFIILFFVPGHAFSFVLSQFVKIDGRPRLYFACLLSGAALNIALDALFVGVLGWGLRGAALATSIAYSLSTFVVLPHFFTDRARLKFLRPSGSWSPLLRAVFNGFSEFINEISAGVVIFLFNLVMMRRFGPSGVAAFTIVNYILFFGLMISYGVADALQPLLSTNFGARREERIGGFIRLGLLANGGMGLVIIAVILIFPAQLIGIFLGEGEAATITTARRFLVYFWPAMLANGLNIAFSSYFTSLHKAAHSAVIALSRSLALPVLFILSLSVLLGDVGIFIAIPLAEYATLLMSLFFFSRNRPRKVLAAAAV